MSPPTELFPASELEWRIQGLPNGRRRKGTKLDLKECELMELVQYDCVLGAKRNSPVRCFPVERLFRKYVTKLTLKELPLDADNHTRCRDGTIVETTTWEERE